MIPGEGSAQGSVDLPRSATEPRDWRSADGKVIKAELVRFEGTVARMRRSDNQIVEIPIDLFHEEDQRELLRLRFVHTFEREPLPSGTAVNLRPAGLSPKELEDSTYPYFRFGDDWWSFRLHVAHGQGRLPPFSTIQLRIDAAEKIEMPAPDNQVFPRTVGGAAVPFDFQVPAEAAQAMMDRMNDDGKSVELAVGYDTSMEPVELGAADQERIRDGVNLLRLLARLFPKQEAVPGSWLKGETFGLDTAGSEPLGIDDGSTRQWTNVLGQSIEGRPQAIERDRLVFLAGSERKETALKNLVLESRKQIADIRLAEAYYHFTESDGNRDFYQPYGESIGARGSLSHFVFSRSREGRGFGLWLYVATSNPEMETSDGLTVFVDDADGGEGIRIRVTDPSVFSRTYRGVHWRNHVYPVRRGMALNDAFLAMRSLRFELSNGDRSILIEATPKEIRDLQDGFYLYREFWEMQELAKKSGN